MNKNFKQALPLITLIFVCGSIVTFLLFNLKIEKDMEVIYQKLSQEQFNQREATERNYLMGKFDPALRNDFALVPEQYSTINHQMYLRKETLKAFLMMEVAASKDQIELKIASATRNFNYQKSMWQNEWSGFKLVDGQNLASLPESLRFKKILEYTALPGASRHHWGTEIDINGANIAYFETDKAQREYQWMVKNAMSFGFCQTYRSKGIDRRTGYNEEKWHWSYLPLAKTFTEEYKNLVHEEDIKGFLGDEYVKGENLINDHVLSINPDCI